VNGISDKEVMREMLHAISEDVMNLGAGRSSKLAFAVLLEVAWRIAKKAHGNDNERTLEAFSDALNILSVNDR